MKTSRFLIAASLAVGAAGCPKAPQTPSHIELYAISAPPPARQAELVTKDDAHTLRIHAGVAFAVHVSVSMIAPDCTFPPTQAPTLTIADPTILRGRLLARGPSDTEWVLWGVKEGKTTVHLAAAECATRDYDVTVVAQPKLPQNP